MRSAVDAAAPHVSRFARSPDNAWLFVFLPALVMCAVLSSRHFAPRRVGRLEVRRGFESAAAAIFESQLHGYRGADESDDMEGDETSG